MKSLSKDQLDNFFRPLISNNLDCIEKYNRLKLIRKAMVAILIAALIGTSLVFMAIIRSIALYYILRFLATIDIIALCIIQLIIVVFRNVNVIGYYGHWLKNVPNFDKYVVTNFHISNTDVQLYLRDQQGKQLSAMFDPKNVIYIPEIGEILYSINGYYFNRFGVPISMESVSYLGEYLKTLDATIYHDSKFGTKGYGNFYFTDKVVIKSAHSASTNMKTIVWIKYADYDEITGKSFEGVINIWWDYFPNQKVNIDNLGTWIKSITPGMSLKNFYKNYLIDNNCTNNIPFIGNIRSILPSSFKIGFSYGKFEPPCKIKVYGYLKGLENSKIRRYLKCH